jgi:hypothetical protein
MQCSAISGTVRRMASRPLLDVCIGVSIAPNRTTSRSSPACRAIYSHGSKCCCSAVIEPPVALKLYTGALATYLDLRPHG